MTDTNAPQGTPLPEGFEGGAGFDGIDTVEKLAEAYKGASAKTFLDFLPEEARKDPNITKYETPEAFYKGHKSALELVGKKGVIIPGENAKPEEIASFRKAMNIPDKPEGYTFSQLKDLHPELKLTPEGETGFKSLMHKYNIPLKSADGIFQEYFGILSQALKDRDEELQKVKDQSETKLRQEWGQNYETNVNIAKRLVTKFGGKEALDAFGDLGNNVGVLRFLATLGQKISEDSFAGVGDLSLDAAGAKARIAQIEQDKAFMDDKAPNHKALVEERARLYEVAETEG